MAYIFNDDKTEIIMENVIKRKSYSKEVTIGSNNKASARFDFSSDELYLKDYRAVGVVGWALNRLDGGAGGSRLDLNTGGAYMTDNVTAIVNFYNTTSSSINVRVSIDILWVKQ